MKDLSHFGIQIENVEDIVMATDLAKDPTNWIKLYQTNKSKVTSKTITKPTRSSTRLSEKSEKAYQESSP